MNTVLIDNFIVGRDHSCFIISEIGAMYEDLDGMKELIRQSKWAGADAVKLQTYRADTITLPGAEFEFEDGSRMSQYDFFKRYEISPEDHKALFDCAREEGILLFSTPSHYEDVELLVELGAPCLKTGSDDLTNYPLLEYMAKTGLPLILSTGMSTLQEVEEALEVVHRSGNDQVILLHCTVSYPPEPQFANLNVIKTMQMAFDVPVGYSDHTVGVFPPALAASMGASAIEKHVTLDRSLGRPDSQVALEPNELKIMVDNIRSIPILQGSSAKHVTEQEIKWRKNARKSLVAAKDLKKGEILNPKDVKILRPGTGIHPRYKQMVTGRSLRKDLRMNEIIPEDAV